jgi:uncharacterized protein (UPF0264 family)
LVSVQNADEARLAFECGVAWVDLKDPSQGSLGNPGTITCQQFIAVARQFDHSRISLALGEFDDLDWAWVAKWLPEFAVGKVGLAGQPSVTEDIVEALAPFRGDIVPAIYADWQRAGSPRPEDVLALARDIEAPFVLIDTFEKDGRGLLHWLDVSQLSQLQQQAHALGAGLVIAGSLRIADWPQLELLEQITIGVRGAVCTSQLCQREIKRWLAFVNESTVAVDGNENLLD